MSIYKEEKMPSSAAFGLVCWVCKSCLKFFYTNKLENHNPTEVNYCPFCGKVA